MGDTSVTSYNVSSGAVSSGMVISSGDGVVVDDGGTTSNIVISSGGFEFVYSGGVASGTNVAGGGTLVMLPGAVGNGTSAATGGHVVSTNAVVDLAGGSLTVTYGTLIGGTIGAGATDYVLNGGIINAATASGGNIIVEAGGAASNVVVNSGGGLDVLSGGYTTRALIEGNGSETLFGSSFYDSVYHAQEFVSGIAYDANLYSGSYQQIGGGGKAVSAFVFNSGTQAVWGGGAASGTVVSSGGFQEVLSTGVASGTTISAGGYEFVSGGGSAVSTTVSSGGVMFVYSGGIASGTDVLTGGTMIVLPGAIVSHTTGTAISTGFVTMGYAFSGNWTLDTATPNFGTVSGYQAAYILSAGRLIGANNHGMIEIFQGGATSGTHTTTSATVQIFQGGIDSGSFAVSGGFIAAQGTLIGATISSGGHDTVFSSGVASNTSVGAGGIEVISTGGSSFYSDVTSGGEQSIASGGAASNTSVGGGGAAIVSGGGSAVGASVASGGFLFVLGGGSAAGTSVASGGAFFALPGANASGASTTGVVVLNANQTLAQATTGAVTSASFTSGQTAYVLTSGILNAASASGFATVRVFSGGVANNTQILSGDLTVYAGGIASGTDLAASLSLLTVSGQGSAVGTNVGSGSVEYVFSGGTANSGTVNGGGMEYMAAGATVNQLTIMSGGLIDAAGLAFDPTGSAVISGNQLTVTEGAGTLSLQLAGNYTGVNFTATADGAGGTLITDVACYCRGTRVAAEHGAVAVEDLRIGDRLITLDGAAKPIKWIGKRAYAGRFAAQNPQAMPILIARDALADGIPFRDLLVSPMHALWLEGALIPARYLVNGVSIRRLRDLTRVEYFHLELENHAVIWAEGAPAESYIDDSNRGMFQNAAEYPVLYPAASPLPARYCAPRLEHGPVVRAWQEKLAQRAGVAASVEQVTWLQPGINSIRIAAGVTQLRLMSDTAYAPGDRRRLGALIGEIILDGAPIALDDPRLMRGFYGDTASTTWTDGEALIEIEAVSHDHWCFVEVLALSAKVMSQGGL